LSSQPIARAVAILERGGLVAFPTETVYGLGADASNDAAVARIYRVKGRPAGHPLIVHIGTAAKLDEWARDIPDSARRLARRFWPGPLTLVLKRSASVHDVVTGGQDTIGLRVPGHPLALELLGAFGGGIAAPSANKFGRISPTTAEHVRRDLGDEVDLILDGGPCEVGIESTIVDLSGDRPVLLRPGRVSAAEVAEVIGAAPRPRHAASPRAPGMLETHYAPRTPMQLVSRDELERAAAGSDHAVLAFGEAPGGARTALWLRASGEPEHYARELYSSLRRLDEAGARLILVERPPQAPGWEAVADRLARAAQRRVE
jgi:L-threonylcarbamoyladenylate synthase